MMTMPLLNATETQVENVNTFGGYNHKMSINDGEFFDMKNLACDDFPLAASRAKRGLHPAFSIPGAEIIGVCGQDKLNVVYSTKITYDIRYYRYEYGGTIIGAHTNREIELNELIGRTGKFTIDGVEHEIEIAVNDATTIEDGKYFLELGFLGGQFPIDNESDFVTDEPPKLIIADYDISAQQYSHNTVITDKVDGEHTVIKMGAYVVIFPEKIKVNTAKISNGLFEEIKSLEKNLDYSTGAGINCRMCYHDGKSITVNTVSPTAPNNPAHGRVWIDTSEHPAVMRKYNANLATWAVIAPYIEFYSASELGIEEYDALEVEFGEALSNCIELVENQKYYVVSSAGKYDAHGYSPNDYYFRFPVTFKNDIPYSYSGFNAKFNTSLPVLDYVFECNNRLWGCRYGEDSNGAFINEIFASRLGDPGNFHYFANTSMDSYYVSLGDEGPFTGGIAYNSQPVFFRQNKVHRISGSFPANYQLKTTVGYGCQKGSYRSIVSVNNIVYYLSTVGIMAYSGDIPVSMADAFGTEMYHAGVAGTIGNKYYISMHAEDGTPVLFVYDDAKAMWHKEDDLDVKQFLSYDGECYAVTEDNRLVATGGVTGALEPDFGWMMETGEIGYSSPFKKHLIKVNIRLKLGISSHCIMDINYDSGDNWIHCADIRPTGRVHMVNIPISPYRCDYFKIRIRGTGEVKLLSVIKFYNEGSDEA